MAVLPDGGRAERHDVGRRTEDYHGEQELHCSKELAFFASVNPSSLFVLVAGGVTNEERNESPSFVSSHDCGVVRYGEVC